MTRIQWIGILVILLEAKENYGQSLARKKKVTLYSRSGDWNVSYAVDGSYSNCAALNIYDDLEIDLGETNTFTRIVLYSGPTETRRNLYSLALFLDSIYIRIHYTEYGIHGLYYVKLHRPYSARYIKLRMRNTQGNLLRSLCEVDVFNDAIISEGRVTSSSSTYTNCISALAVDGLISTLNLDSCAGTVKETDPWLTVYLGDTFLVTFIEMYGRQDKEYDGQSFGGMEIQLDGRDIYTVPNGKFINNFEMSPVPEKIGRRVKFILVGSNRSLVICEVVISGERVISIGKHASISTDYLDWDASRAVDGDYRTLPDLNCCTASNLQKDPYLRLNLGNVHRVTRIAIYGRTDESFEGMMIEANNSFTRNVTAQVKGQWINFYTFQLSTTVLASEITVTLPGANQQLVVCELLVYGDCSDGYFSQGCSRQCHCEGLTCDTITGVCPSRICKPGYIGLTCSEDCSDGYFGQGCSRQCHCEGLTCDTIIGVCPSRICKPGYIGLTCSEDCRGGYFGQGCSRQCHCEGLTCDTIIGVCPSRICKPGYIGLTCSEECKTGTFGFNCEHRCGMCTGGAVCDIHTGVCQKGCTDGYKGGQCLQKMYDETSVSLPVFLGSFFGVTFVLTPITIVLACLLYRMRLHRTTKKSANREDAPIALQNLPNTESNYDALHLDNTNVNSAHPNLSNTESNYDALQLDNTYVNSAHPNLPNTESNHDALQLDNTYVNSANPNLPNTQSNYDALQLDNTYVNSAHPNLPNTQSNYDALQLDNTYVNSAHPNPPNTQSKL